MVKVPGGLVTCSAQYTDLKSSQYITINKVKHPRIVPQGRGSQRKELWISLKSYIDSMAQWLDYRPECCEVGFRVQSHARVSRGSMIALYIDWGNSWKKNLLYPSFIVCHPVKGRDLVDEFHIHFISLSVMSAFIQKGAFILYLS